MIKKISNMNDFLKIIYSLKISRIYVVSPLSAKSKAGIVANMLTARDKCHSLNGLLRGTAKAWCPHGYLPQFLDDSIPEERELGMRFGIELLHMSGCLYCFGDILSTGMIGEIIKAYENNKPVLVEENLYDKVCELIENAKIEGHIE